MLRLRAVSEVGAQVSGATRVPQASPLAGRGTSPLRAGARPHWDHPASREHTCHRAEPSPPRTPAPQSRPQRRAPRRRLYSGGRTKTTQTPLNAKEKGGGEYFPAEAASAPRQRAAQGMPGPSADLSLPPGSAPPAPPTRSAARPGAHLLGSGFRRSSSLAVECGAAAAAAFAATTAATATEALPGAPPRLEAGGRGIPGGAGPGRRRAEQREVVGARRGASGERATRAREVTTLPPGWARAAGGGKREPGEGAGGRATPERPGLAPGRPARTGQRAARGGGGRRSARPARCAAGELLRASTLLCRLQLLHI